MLVVAKCFPSADFYRSCDREDRALQQQKLVDNADWRSATRVTMRNFDAMSLRVLSRLRNSASPRIFGCETHTPFERLPQHTVIQYEGLSPSIAITLGMSVWRLSAKRAFRQVSHPCMSEAEERSAGALDPLMIGEPPCR